VKLAIIPARGGSKRIPRKNIKEFDGKPIIAFAIQAALESGCFDTVMVSTDDAEISVIARFLGAEVPFMRSAQMSGDGVGTVPVLLDVLEKYRQQGKAFSDICCIYPCNPFLTAEKLAKGLDKHIKSKASSTFPVVAYSYPIWRSLRFNGFRFEMLWPENYHARSQDLGTVYHDAGQFYWLNPLDLAKERKLFMDRSEPLIYSELEVQDIDTLEDWALAEVKYQLWRNSQSSLSAQASKGPSVP